MQLLRINYPSILYQASLLSCLSTAVGLVHEPPLPNGVVNLQQPNSGTQCGAHGRWTDPNAHRHNTQLLGDSASHPPLRRHQNHHQLAHVSWPAANVGSHMKINFFQEKNSSKCMTFAVQLTGQHQAVCTTITHHRRAGGLCQVNSGGHCSLCSHDPLHSQWECEDQEEPNSQMGSSQIISRQAGNLEREVTPEPTHQDADNCAVNIVIVPGALNYNSARGTEHLRCHGHIGQLWKPETVFGSGQVR